MQRSGRPLDPLEPPKPAKFKITSSQRKLLKAFNPEGLPDFRTREFKRLSYEEKEDYILNELAIAKENRKEQKKQKILNKLYYTEIDVSVVFPYYGGDYHQREFIELTSIFYKLYKSYRGMNIVIRYVNNNQILMTLVLDIPINNFSRWWKNYSKFGYGIFEGLSDSFIYKQVFIDEDFNGYLYIYKQIDKNENNDQKIFIKQFFKDHPISNCLLEPIKQWAINIKDNAQTKSTYYRYKKIEEKINNYIDKYLDSGVPQDEIENICNDLQIDIDVSLPLQKDIKLLEAKSNKKPLKNFHFINTKFNHIDLNAIVYENKIINTDKEFIINLKKQLDNDNKFYMYKMNDNIITSIITEDGQYKIYNEFQDDINNFEIETGLNNCKICDIKDFELSKFIRDSCHYNCSLKFVDKLDEYKSTNFIYNDYSLTIKDQQIIDSKKYNIEKKDINNIHFNQLKNNRDIIINCLDHLNNEIISIQNLEFIKNDEYYKYYKNKYYLLNVKLQSFKYAGK